MSDLCTNCPHLGSWICVRVSLITLQLVPWTYTPLLQCVYRERWWKVHTSASKSCLLLSQLVLCAPNFGLCINQLTYASTPIANHTHPLLLVVRPHLPLASPPQAPLLSSSSSSLQAWEPFFDVVADASSLVVSHASIPIPCVYLSLRENELMCKHGSWKILEQYSASTAVQSCARSTCSCNHINRCAPGIERYDTFWDSYNKKSEVQTFGRNLINVCRCSCTG